MAFDIDQALDLVGPHYRTEVERSRPGEWAWRTEANPTELVVVERWIDGDSVMIRFFGEDHGDDIRAITQNRQAVPTRQLGHDPT